MYIPKEIIDQVIQQSNIVDVINEFVSLKKRGVNYLGNCPFHDEKTPSFSVSPAKGIYKCFGCGAAGNVSKFIMDHEKISYPEAIKYLAKKANIEIPEKELTDEEKKAHSERESLLIINQFAQKYFSHILTSNKTTFDKAGWEYLSKTRGFKNNIIDKFQLGYCLDQKDAFTKTAIGKGYKQDYLIKLGLTGKDKTVYDRYKGRVIFPFHSLSGQIIGFTGRVLPGDTKKKAKYLNSTESDLFHKREILYGLYQAKQAIVKADTCYLVEGNTDVISWHQAGIENTVASSGTALTSSQVKLLSRFTGHITLVFDGDEAGIKAIVKSIEIILSEGLNCDVVMLPDGEDPDSYASKNTADIVKDYLADNKQGFLDFLMDHHSEDLKSPDKKSDAVRSIIKNIGSIPDKMNRDVYMNILNEKVDIKNKILAEELEKTIPKEDKSDKKLFALDHATDAIKENECVIFYRDTSDVINNHLNGHENTVGYSDNIYYKDIQTLLNLTKKVVIGDQIKKIYENFEETPVVKLCISLIKKGFNVYVDIPEDKRYSHEGEYNYDELSFLQGYIYLLSGVNIMYDIEFEKTVLENAAEILCLFDQTTIVKKTPDISKALGIQKGEFNKILKPFLEQKRNKSQLQREDIVIDDTRYEFDINNIPDYVDMNFFYKYNYFPVQNKKGQNIFYMFRNENNTLIKVGNFHMDPLFQVYNIDPAKNKRIVKLTHAEMHTSDYVEFPSASMIDLGAFKKFLWNEGGYIFSNGKQYHHDKILESIALQFPKCYELEELGQQHEDFYAFVNCIYADKEIIPMDDLGKVQYDNKTYYSPAVSKIHTKQRKGMDKYENERYFSHRPGKTTFQEWSNLMDQVYKYNDNGKFALVFSIMAAYRSIIYDIDRLFTAPFFIGPTESGKTQIAISIRSLFIDPVAPLFNLNSGTDAAFFTTLEKYRDVPIVYEEYNDIQISDVKFQGLKAAVYDGEGKTKRTGADTKDLDVSKVNCAPVLLGQESPERDDGSLSNRCVICHVPKKDDWTEEEVELFRRLKEAEKDGLSNVLISILDKRDIIKAHYKKTLRIESKRLKEDLQSSGAIYQTRILNTISLFTTMVKIIEDHCPDLQLSFSFADFYSIAKKKLIAQSEAIHQTNRLAVFFDTIELLLHRENGGIDPGKHFKIETSNSLTIMKSRKETEEKVYDTPTKILFLRLNIIHPLYRDIHKVEALKMNSLMNYIKDHPAFIGNVKSTRFEWQEVITEGVEGDYATKKMRSVQSNTSAVAFNYELLEVDLEKYSNISMVNKNEEPEKEADANQLVLVHSDQTDDQPF